MWGGLEILVQVNRGPAGTSGNRDANHTASLHKYSVTQWKVVVIVSHQLSPLCCCPGPCGPPLEACALLVIMRYHSVERPGSFLTSHFALYSSRRYFISSSKRQGTQSRVTESSVGCPSKAVPITNPPHELHLYEHSTRFTGRVISRLILPSLYKLPFNHSGSPNCLHSVTFDIDGASLSQLHKIPAYTRNVSPVSYIKYLWFFFVR
jgi:hypothetical protein